MLWTVLTIAEVLYLAVLSVWIVLEKRSPVATLAWILALAALPGIGFVIFLVFGPRRLTRRRLKRQRARMKVRKQHANDDYERPATDAVPLRTKQLQELATVASGMPPTHATAAALLKGGDEVFATIEEAIGAARHHVHLAYYIFTPGKVGTRIRDALVARARAGVHVRLLVDALGSYGLGRRFLRPLRDAGAEVAAFNPVSFARFQPRINFRNHRKVVVVDGDVGFLGGVNVADEYLASDGGAPPWRDLHMKLEGAAVRWLQLAFLEDWYFATERAPHGKTYFPPIRDQGEHLLQVVPSGPDLDWQAILKVYFASISAAQQRVLIATPYFVPDDAVHMALVTAAMRGVDVRILVPARARNDARIVAWAARSYFDELLRAGVRIFEYQPAMFHAKSLVVDEDIASIGSANMDNRSFRLNFEIAAMLYGKRWADELAEVFETDLRNAREVRAADRSRLPRTSRFIEAGARLLSPLL